ncbi:MAG: hypothetical protein N4A71_24330 [Carboxylicivirga sp.]|jgi:hypothetical protein|nr:hypothetical protein [Carboxylicivirga sp.]
MNTDNKNHSSFDQFLRQELSKTHEPSPNFVDQVMDKVEAIQREHPKVKYLGLFFKVAAACAIIISLTNALILLSNNTGNTNDNDWSSVYEQSAPANWYDYYEDETFLANNQTIN